MVLKIEYLPVDALRPYENNARKHADEDVDAIAASIRKFGFDDPIGIWSDDNLIVEGHGRLLAAQKLGMETVPCIRLDHLTDEQRRAYALAHNRTAELSGWDFAVRDEELARIGSIDMSAFGFKLSSDWFSDRKRWDNSKEEENTEYNEFIEKFETKKTTDDCYTPDNIYDVVADWVANEYGIDRSKFVRPFYPNGDYESFDYPRGCAVVDNPPFSILAKITRFYVERGIKFFLFAPTLTLFSVDSDEVCHICAGCCITYENGARVNTSFKTNMENGVAIRTAPELTKTVLLADKKNTKSIENKLRYEYPSEVVTAAKASQWSELGVVFSVPRLAVRKISALDAQKRKNIQIFGDGFLLSHAQAAQAAQAAGVDEADINGNGAIVWKLSKREREIISELDRAENG